METPEPKAFRGASVAEVRRYIARCFIEHSLMPRTSKYLHSLATDLIANPG